MTMHTASNAKAEAISVIQGGSEIEAISKNKRADAWQGFYTALMSLKSCSTSSCGTPSTAVTEASWSEIGSSHGSSSPRKLRGDTELEDEDVSDMDASDMDASDIDAIDEEDSELMQDSPSKRTRRRPNRRRRTRGGRRSAARRARLRAEAAACATIDEELTAERSCPCSSPSSRDVVLLSDLGFVSPTVYGGCLAQSKMPNTPADYQGNLCNSKFGTPARTSTGPCNAVGTLSTGADASARVPAPTSMPTAVPGSVWSDQTIQCSTTPASPHPNAGARPCAVVASMIRESSVQPGSACLPSGAAWPMPLEPRSPQQAPNLIQVAAPTNLAPNGSCAVLLIPPCHAWLSPAGGMVSTSSVTAPAGSMVSISPMTVPAGGMMSTSPMTAPAGGMMSTSPMTAPGQCSSSGGTSMACAGSRSADALRSWLQASGFPPAADIVAQLQAAAPDFYED
mmetsp:Transcript_30361/g.49487  ORF Transcript_30361/g.49487 Transcript_30361/m.49487 type:complete len:453 (-) Transcript_30361:64-1422(-)